MKKLILFGVCIVVLSCRNYEKYIPSQEQVQIIREYDGWNMPDSAISLIESLNYEASYNGDFSVKLIYCRNLHKVHRSEEANLLYKRYISESGNIDEKWRYNSEYLIMLGELNDYEMMKQYSDTIVECCADSLNSFRDMRALYHFWAAKGVHDCQGMKLWLDSMDYWSPRMVLRLVDSTDLALHISEFDELCP